MTHCPGATTLLLRWPTFCLWNVYFPGLHSLWSMFLPALLSLSRVTLCPRFTSSLLRQPTLCLWKNVAPWINLLSLYCGSLLNSFLCKATDPHLVAHPKGLTQDLGHKHLLIIFPTPPPSRGAPDLEALISNRVSSPPTRQRLSGFPVVCSPDVALAQEGVLLPLGLPLAPCYPASLTLWL